MPTHEAAVPVQHTIQRRAGVAGADQAGSGYRPRIHHPVQRPTTLPVQRDRVERLSGRLHPDPRPHRRLPEVVEDQRVRQRLADPLHREGNPAVADLVDDAIQRRRRDPEPRCVGVAELVRGAVIRPRAVTISATAPMITAPATSVRASIGSLRTTAPRITATTGFT